MTKTNKVPNSHFGKSQDRSEPVIHEPSNLVNIRVRRTLSIDERDVSLQTLYNLPSGIEIHMEVWHALKACRGEVSSIYACVGIDAPRLHDHVNAH